MLISADAVGVAGIINANQSLSARPHYEFMPTMMADGVNAAIDGAFAGGVTSFVVNDAHLIMTNVQIERLDPRATLITGFHKPLCMVARVNDADAVFFFGYHCRAGDSDDVTNETILGREIVESRLNGQPVGESEIDAAVSGQFGVPVVFASGDGNYEKELRQTLPNVEFGLTKHALDRWVARCLAPEKSHANIRGAAQRAVERAKRGEFSPDQLNSQVSLSV